MADPAKQVPVHGGTLISDLRSLFSILKAKRTVAFLYGFMFAFVVCTGIIAFAPSTINSGAPWFTNVFTSSTPSTSAVGSSDDSSRSQFSPFLSYFFPQNNYSSSPPPPPYETNFSRSINTTSPPPTLNSEKPVSQNQTQTNPKPDKPQLSSKNQTWVGPNSNENSVSVQKNQTQVPKKDSNQTQVPKKDSQLSTPSASPENSTNKTASSPKSEKKSSEVSNSTASFEKKESNNGTSSTKSGVSVDKEKKVDAVESLKKCDFFDGEWVKDDKYKVYYKPGSCSLIDEQFNCVLNGRPDKDYQKFKWKPKGCDLPRLDGKHMLEMLRGKRLVFVGDSLNRNMWESLVCILKTAAKDPKRVYEAHGRHHFRGEAEYSFVFQDYGCTVEFFVSPFLVQEWEMTQKNGTKKETLRLDLVGKTSAHYKTADIIIFNTGHWWTHDKTSKGQDYYQEGSHVYEELNVLEAFRKAMTTWGRWIDANVNPKKSLVFFRGYSHSHFSGGQWNSGGACDSETLPISDEKYLRPYLPKMMILEKVLRGMKTPVTYLNITKMTDFRKDGHPSIYRKQHISEKERRSQLLYQDCSHWCLPGVPDAWNELVYAELLVKLGQQKQQQKKA